MPESSTKLTKRSVDAAHPRATRYQLWDTELKDFGLRVASSGTKTYMVRYRPRGIGPGAPKRFVVIGRNGAVTPDEARARARTILGAVAAGRDPAREQARSADMITVARLVDLFIEEHVRVKRKIRTASGYTAVLRNNPLPRHGKRAADRITAAVRVDGYLEVESRSRKRG